MTVANLEELASMSIEQMEAMALGQATPAASAEGNVDEADPLEAAATATDPEATPVVDDQKQDVSQASSSQVSEAAKPAEKPSDKEMNFAKLRSKTESLEREVQRLADENRLLAERSAYVANLPEGHAEKIAEIDSVIASLGTKYQNGEIEFSEYQMQLMKANNDRLAMVAAELKAQIANEMREQSEKALAENAQKTWAETVDSFIAAKPDSIDYATDEAKNKDLNVYVKALAADPDNEGRPMDWFLTEAHTLVKAKHGVVAQAKQDTQAPVVTDPAKPAIPFHTLSEVPSGITPTTSEIEQLGSLSGAALSNRFANMTSEQINAELAKLG